AQLRLVAEREQRLVATRRDAIARHLQHLLRRHEGAGEVARRLGEGAIMADITAKPRQWNEHLARNGDGIAKAMITQTPTGRDQSIQISTGGKRKSLFITKATTLDKPRAPIGKLVRHDPFMLLIKSYPGQLFMIE